MRSRTLSLYMVKPLLLVPLVACSPPGDDALVESESDDGQLALTVDTPVPGDDVIEGSVVGDITDISEVQKTITLVDEEGDAWEFMYSEATRVEGTGGAQGLAGREGSLVVIEYAEDPEALRAIEIQIMDDPRPEFPELP